MNNPKSIFTGTVSREASSHNPETRRLSTPEYHETLRKPATVPGAVYAPSLTPTENTSKGEQWPTPPIPEHSASRKRSKSSSKAPKSLSSPQSPDSAKRKRFTATPTSVNPPAQSASEPLHKRRRLDTIPKAGLGLFNFEGASTGPDQPPSPLFFSYATRKRPALPARLSSSEAGARMLQKAGREEASIKTVTLPRGSIAESSSTGVTSAPNGGRMSMERSSVPSPATPDPSRKDVETLRILGQIGVVELLDQDPRPTFIIDLAESTNISAATLHLLFANETLRSHTELVDLLTHTASEESPSSAPGNAFLHFKAWALSPAVQSSDTPEIPLPPTVFAGITWNCSTLRKRFRVVSGVFSDSLYSTSSSRTNPSNVSRPYSNGPTSNEAMQVSKTPDDNQDYFGAAAPPSDDTSTTSTIQRTIEPGDTTDSVFKNSSLREIKTHEALSSMGGSSSYTNECVLRAATSGDIDTFTSSHPSPSKEQGFFDWTRLPFSVDLPRHIQFARSIDWASTSLGPINTWSADLRQMCNLIMASPHPAAMYWGDDLVAIYNEAYVLLAGQKHPRLMGQKYSDAWAEIWRYPFSPISFTGETLTKSALVM